jgi:hypothetical protein
VPFGNVNVVGLNGILFFVISARDHTEYHFLDICSFNIAKWRGNADKWTAVIQTGIPPEGAPKPPENLRWGSISPGSKPMLAWDASPSDGIASYNIYRQRCYGGTSPAGLSVTFDTPYEKIASVPAGVTSTEVDLLSGGAGASDTPWYTVTAVDEKGLESAYAKNKELVKWGPVGNAKVERDDMDTVSVVFQGSNSWVQVRNSFIVRRDEKLRFAIMTESSEIPIFRLSVGGIGDVNLPLDKFEGWTDTVADGNWHELSIDLRGTLDRIAAEKNVQPSHARTTWNEDWVAMSFQFGNWGSDSQDESTFLIRDLDVSPR